MNESPQVIRTLLVDDEADFRRPLVKRLSRRGIEVKEAASGWEALEALEHQPVDVVVMDVKMPEMDGLSALSRIKAVHPDTEVILLTGQASAQDGVSGMKAGAFDYLSKPVEIDHLAGKIRQAYDKIMRKQEQKLETEYRARMEQRMIATERLASLGTLAAGVAHEINNPLAIIYEAAGWLKSVMGKDNLTVEELGGKLALALEKIENSVVRAKKITHQLLDFARETDCNVHEVDTGKILTEVVDFTFKPAMDAGVRVFAQPSPENVIIWSDPYKLRQVLINLVTNGIQASRDGGNVILAQSRRQGEVVISVTDNGTGIPKEILEKIFEPFFSTKPPGKGTGLGLSVSRGIVEKLGGRIDVESQIGVGSCFRVSLPIRPLNHSDLPNMAAEC